MIFSSVQHMKRREKIHAAFSAERGRSSIESRFQFQSINGPNPRWFSMQKSVPIHLSTHLLNEKSSHNFEREPLSVNNFWMDFFPDSWIKNAIRMIWIKNRIWNSNLTATPISVSSDVALYFLSESERVKRQHARSKCTLTYKLIIIKITNRNKKMLDAAPAENNFSKRI